MQQQLMFKLDQNPNGRGLRCDSDGLFLGRDALLCRDRLGSFEPRPVSELQRLFGRVYSDDETNWESRIRSVQLVANALNKGDMARATMTAVLMRLPDPGSAIRVADVNGVLAKAGFDPDEPRDERGRWTRDGAEDAAPSSGARDSRVQLTEDAMSDAVNDPVVEAARHAASASQRNSGAAHTQAKPVGAAHEDFWQVLGEKLSDGAKAWLAEVGRADMPQSRVDIAAAHAAASQIGNEPGADSNYAFKPWFLNGERVQVPIFNTGSEGGDAGLAISHILDEPDKPITRPGINADWMYPLIGLTSFAGEAAAPFLRLFGSSARIATVAPEIVEPATETTADSVWALPPMQRGVAIENKLAVTNYADWYHVGAESNGYFPLVDFQKDDTLLSLRTVDTTSSRWFARTLDHIEDLGDNGATIDGKLAKMKLDLRVQPGGFDAAQPLAEEGEKKGVIVDIKEFP